MPAAPLTVLITGCSSGIGRALARAFRTRGCEVYATARRPEQIAELAQEGIHALTLDVDTADSIESLRNRLKSDGVVPDVLINNAGYGLMGPLADTSIDALRQQFETNVFGLMAVTRALLPGMVARRRGCIVNIGSVSGVLTTPFAGAYCASKAAVHALSDALRMELAPLGIHVMTVQPGAIRSQFGSTAQRGVELAPDSWYTAVADGVAARAGASQQHATDADDFARQLCTAVLSTRRPALLRIGNGSRALPAIARWVPQRLRDRMLMRRFGLQRLGS